MNIIYIAGPFRASNHWEQEQNIRRAEELALEVWRAGFACICPHTNTRFFQGATDDAIWLEGYLAILAKCDGVLMVHGWEKSFGAKKELEFAQDHRIPIYYNVPQLVKHFPN